MGPNLRTDTEASPTASSPNTFSPYKDADDVEIPLLDPPLGPAADVEDGQIYDAVSPQTPWQRFIMAFRRRPNHAKQLADSPATLVGQERAIRSTKRRWLGRMCVGIPIFVLVVLGILHVIEVLLGFGSSLLEFEYDDFLPDYGRPGHLGDGMAEYPTDFTRDVEPIPCHSHNDYWRRVPLYQAIHYGCTGVEADVWLFDDDLFVGHNTVSLTKNRTFRSLYVDPLSEILDRQNPATEFGSVKDHGVFDKNPDQTLVLLVDFKNNGADIYPYVYSQLEPLRSKGYLSYWDGETKHNGPITVVATGNAPFELLVANNTYRDIFFDAPLASFYEPPADRKAPYERKRGQGESGITPGASFDESNSFYASVSFSSAIGFVWAGHLTKHQRNLIRGQIQGAQRRGLKARYWDTPTWPVGLRNHIWDILVEEGADYLNVDDLKGAAKRDWSGKNHGWIR